MGLDPASAPRTNGALGGAHNRGNLLIALLGMLMGTQNDPSTHRKRLRCCVGPNNQQYQYYGDPIRLLCRLVKRDRQALEAEEDTSLE